MLTSCARVNVFGERCKPHDGGGVPREKDSENGVRGVRGVRQPESEGVGAGADEKTGQVIRFPTTPETTEELSAELGECLYRYIDDPEDLPEAIADIETSSRVGIDLETTGLKWWEDKIRLVSITSGSSKTWVVDAFKVSLGPLFEALEEAKIVAHNALFDILFLRQAGFVPGDVGCTMLLSQVRYAGLDNAKHGLEGVAKKLLGVELAKDKQASDWTKDPLDPEQLEYAALDSKHLLDLYEEEVRVLEHVGLDRVKELEEWLLPAVVEISETGMPVDEKRWNDVIEEAGQRLGDLRNEMNSYITTPLPEDLALANKKNKNIEEDRKGKVNWASPKQKIWALETALGLKVPTTKGREKKKTLDKNHLHLIDHPIAELLLEHQAIQNLPSTYLKAIKERFHDGYIYPDWNQL